MQAGGDFAHAQPAAFIADAAGDLLHIIELLRRETETRLRYAAGRVDLHWSQFQCVRPAETAITAAAAHGKVDLVPARAFVDLTGEADLAADSGKVQARIDDHPLRAGTIGLQVAHQVGHLPVPHPRGSEDTGTQLPLRRDLPIGENADIGIKAAAVHPIRPEALAARQQRRQEFSRGLEGEAVIVQRLVQQAGERDQCEARRRIPARDQRAAETVFTRAVLPAFNPGRRAETQAELAADREHGIHFGIHRAPFVGCKQRAARSIVTRPAETEIDKSGGGREGAAQCRQANADGGGAADAGAGRHDGIEIQAIDADIASGDRRKPAHVHLVVDADHLAADCAAKGVSGLAHGVFV